MSDELITNAALVPPGGVTPAGPTRTSSAGAQSTDSASEATTGTPSASFASVLAEAQSTDSPTFSKHALERLTRRGVELDSNSLSRLTDGIQKAAQKGSRNSVVFVDGTAYVASVQNNTVITAVTPEAMNSHVFTNIDSAVVA